MVAYTFRPFQTDYARLLERTREGNIEGKNHFAPIVPGGGKTSLILQMADLIPERADAIAHVAPRVNLTKQAVRFFNNPEMSFLCNHDHKMRYLTDSVLDPCRDCIGFSTTYDRIQHWPDIFKQEFERKRYLLVLDEPHHIRDNFMGLYNTDLPSKQALEPLVDLASHCLFMSGTFERWDRYPIAFLPYEKFGREYELQFPDDATVEFSRVDALKHGKILTPVTFHKYDSDGKWLDENGKRIDATSFHSEDQPTLLSVVLETDFAKRLIRQGIEHWRQYCNTTRVNAKCIVVAPNWAIANKDYIPCLKQLGIEPYIAAHDDPKAHSNIESFQMSSRPEVLVTVGMAYEGLDVPEATHLVCLTKFRSIPWLYQCFARIWRWLEWKRDCFVFCPDDAMMNEAILVIKREERQAAIEPQGHGPGPSTPHTDVVPLSSSPIGVRHQRLDEIDSPEIIDLANEFGLDPREVQRFFVERGAYIYTSPQIDTNISDVSPNDMERQLRKWIDINLKRVAERSAEFEHTKNPYAAINSLIIKEFGKKRDLLQLHELEKLVALIRRRWAHVINEGSPLWG